MAESSAWCRWPATPKKRASAHFGHAGVLWSRPSTAPERQNGSVSLRGGNVRVLDTWAMLAYLDGEPAAHVVRQVLRNARRRKITVLFSIINYGESLYII